MCLNICTISWKHMKATAVLKKILQNPTAMTKNIELVSNTNFVQLDLNRTRTNDSFTRPPLDPHTTLTRPTWLKLDPTRPNLTQTRKTRHPPGHNNGVVKRFITSIMASRQLVVCKFECLKPSISKSAKSCTQSGNKILVWHYCALLCTTWVSLFVVKY